MMAMKLHAMTARSGCGHDCTLRPPAAALALQSHATMCVAARVVPARTADRRVFHKPAVTARHPFKIWIDGFHFLI
jgi:hypothetical protein